jgi:hypothetical protein
MSLKKLRRMLGCKKDEIGSIRHWLTWNSDFMLVTVLLLLLGIVGDCSNLVI